MPYRQHLSSAVDLITPYAATRAGFVTQALERNRRASPFVQQARDLKSTAETAPNAMALLDMTEIQTALLTAAGISDKADNHLQPKDRRAAILGLIENFLIPAGADFVEELVYRFLLTRGDTLGGSMRNYTGAIAQQRLSGALLARMRNQGTEFRWRQDGGAWADAPQDDAAAALVLNGLHWSVNRQPRTLVYNLTVPIVGKKGNNIDICLFRLCPEDIDCVIRKDAKKARNTATNYVALGELKGGIDPAGADEHWKTAHTALHRIVKGFTSKGVDVHTLFIGAAIVDAMAREIWAMLQDRTLQNAANLTNDNQLTSIVRWLTAL